MTWILALATVLVLGSIAVACYREAREAEPRPNAVADRLLAEAGVRQVVGVGREILLAEASTTRMLSRRQPVPRTPKFRPAPRPGACAR